MSDPTVSQERSGWRDFGLSQRHRNWGWDCPAVDIDFLLLEYDEGKAVAIVEYKNEKAKPQLRDHPSYKALVDIGNRAAIPVFVCRYTSDFAQWIVIPLNCIAKEKLPQITIMNEREYVTFLYWLRGRSLPENLF